MVEFKLGTFPFIVDIQKMGMSIAVNVDIQNIVTKTGPFTT